MKSLEQKKQELMNEVNNSNYSFILHQLDVTGNVIHREIVSKRKSEDVEKMNCIATRRNDDGFFVEVMKSHDLIAQIGGELK